MPGSATASSSSTADRAVVSLEARNKELPAQPLEVDDQDASQGPSSASSESETRAEQQDSYVRALHDYTADSGHACLSFKTGQIIRVLNTDASGWWDGELDGLRGWFPSNYVTPILDTPLSTGLPGPNSNGDSESGSLAPNGLAVASSSSTSTLKVIAAEHMRRAASSPTSSTTACQTSDQHNRQQRLSQYAIYNASVTSFATSGSVTSASTGSGSTSVLFPHNDWLSPGSRPESPALTLDASFASASSTSSSSTNNDVSDTIAHQIQHSISLLRSAVEASRTNHFTPAATCLIASVRSMMCAADCLTRQSGILRTHLPLAKERRHILSALASLVSQSRIASADSLDAGQRKKETDEMLSLADGVSKSVDRFLSTAARCGVHVPDRVESPFNTLANGHSEHLRASSQILRLPDISTPNLDACFQFATASIDPDGRPSSPVATKSGQMVPFPSTKPASASSGSRALQKMRSLGDFKKANRRKANAEAAITAPALPSQSAQYERTAHHNHLKYGLPTQSSRPTSIVTHPGSAAMLRRPSIPAVYTTAALPSPMLDADGKMLDYGLPSAALLTAGSFLPPSWPADDSLPRQSLQKPIEVYRTLTMIHDSLLSTIAALIGHVHAHSRSSHSSSYAHLIDMTRETLESIKEIVFVVDAITAHEAVKAQVINHKSLEKAQEHLESSTTSLVEAASKATSTPTVDVSIEGLARELEEREKELLLKAATSVLRASAQLVSTTKPILLKRTLENVTFALDRDQMRTGARPRSISLDFAHTAAPSSIEDGAGGILEQQKGAISANTSAPADSSRASQGLSASAQTGNRTGPKAGYTVSALVSQVTALVNPRDSAVPPHASEAMSRQCSSSSRSQHGDANGSDESEGEALLEIVSPPFANPARTSARLSPALSTSDETDERSQSSLSTRRGIAVPSNLNLQQPRHGRTPSFGSMSATSTVTSLREKAETPGPRPPALRAIIPSSQPMSAAPSSASSTTSSRAGGEAMSRDESSRGSAASTATSSFRSALSESNTADTSPRSSIHLTSPHDDRLDWYMDQQNVHYRKPSKPEYARARSGSTPDRLAALRISESTAHQAMPSPVSPRLPFPPSPLDLPTMSGAKSWLLERDYKAEECEFTSDGHVRGATLSCLIERMTLHDQTIDPVFSSTFFLTFRMFTAPGELAEMLMARFSIEPPTNPKPTEADLQLWRDKKLTPIRLRVYNFFKTWLEMHWKPESDAVILHPLLKFTRETMTSAMPAPAARLVDLIQKRTIPLQGSATQGDVARPRGLMRLASTEKLKAGKPILEGAPASATIPGAFSSLPPSPIVSKALYALLRTPPYVPTSINDFDPTELARQFTILESKLYCAILPEELISQEYGQKSSPKKVSNIRLMSTMSTRITGWIAEIILSEQDARKRTALVKYFIKLGERCHSLQNYNTLMAILAALNSSTIARLKKTWDGLANKYRVILDGLRRATEHSRNYAQYRAAIRSAVPPCLPFLGLYLTDITFCYDGNPSHRPSPLDADLRLINFDRYQKIAKYVGDLQRFQVPYNLIEVSEIQSFLQNALANLENGGDVQALYRRSLLVEPREPANDAGPYPAAQTYSRDLFNWKAV